MYCLNCNEICTCPEDTKAICTSIYLLSRNNKTALTTGYKFRIFGYYISYEQKGTLVHRYESIINSKLGRPLREGEDPRKRKIGENGGIFQSCIK